MANVLDFIKDSYHEMTQKVSWPSWSELQSSAVVVLVASIIIALIVLAMDQSSSAVMNLIYSATA